MLMILATITGANKNAIQTCNSAQLTHDWSHSRLDACTSEKYIRASACFKTHKVIIMKYDMHCDSVMDYFDFYNS